MSMNTNMSLSRWTQSRLCSGGGGWGQCVCVCVGGSFQELGAMDWRLGSNLGGISGVYIGIFSLSGTVHPPRAGSGIETSHMVLESHQSVEGGALQGDQPGPASTALGSV